MNKTKATPTHLIHFVEATLQMPLLEFSAQTTFNMHFHFPNMPVLPPEKKLAIINFCVWFASLDQRLLYPSLQILMLQCQCCTAIVLVFISVRHAVKTHISYSTVSQVLWAHRVHCTHMIKLVYLISWLSMTQCQKETVTDKY